MPAGKGTYGKKVGRPPRKSAAKKVAKKLNKLEARKVKARGKGKTKKATRMLNKQTKVYAKFQRKSGVKKKNWAKKQKN